VAAAVSGSPSLSHSLKALSFFALFLFASCFSHTLFFRSHFSNLPFIIFGAAHKLFAVRERKEGIERDL
jgi:hypothetical protein